jgi:hypothetical protein
VEAEEEDGGAGGGIERSTGEGVSPTTSPPAVLPLRERMGDDVIDFEVRWCFLPDDAVAIEGFVGRMAGESFFVAGFVNMSSLVGDAARLLVVVVAVEGCWEDGMLADC